MGGETQTLIGIFEEKVIHWLLKRTGFARRVDMSQQACVQQVDGNGSLKELMDIRANPFIAHRLFLLSVSTSRARSCPPTESPGREAGSPAA